MKLLVSVTSLAGLSGLVNAQLPPKPEGVKVVKSKFHPGVKVSYKEPGICETTPGVKSYAGHVHLPPGYMNHRTGENQDYPMNTFFWFFESRKDPKHAPLAIWLNGGPGGSSMMGLFAENGPCKVNDDSRTTRLNPWSWNNEVNMLYIDQPLQTGFSYDTPTNCTADLTGYGFPEPADFSDGLPATNNTFWAGTFPSQKPSHTPNTTDYAAHALWHFGQTFFSEFPGYKPENDRINLFAESYGGHFGPVFMKFFQEQNKKIEDGTIGSEHAHYMHLDTLGIVNGVLDGNIQIEEMIRYPYNNSYGLQLYNQSHYDELMDNFTKPGGCRDQVNACRAHSPLPGKNCTEVDLACINEIYGDYITYAQRGLWNIAHPFNDPFPPPHQVGYFRESSVLQSIGSAVNFTDVPMGVSNAFDATADHLRAGDIDAVGYLLDNGVKVHMMYGDLDWVCNWVGGEKTSLKVPYSRSSDFAAAGYADFVSGHQHKGFTRQFGNFSFTRVFEAGHMVPAYQPRASYDIFMRAILNKDIATGKVPVTDELASQGPLSVWDVKGKAPELPKPKCYVLSHGLTCTEEDWAKVVSGKAVVKDYYVVGEKEEAEEL